MFCNTFLKQRKHKISRFSQTMRACHSGAIRLSSAVKVVFSAFLLLFPLWCQQIWNNMHRQKGNAPSADDALPYDRLNMIALQSWCHVCLCMTVGAVYMACEVRMVRAGYLLTAFGVQFLKKRNTFSLL